MTTLEQIILLHSAYLEAMGLTLSDLPMTLTFERWWYESLKQGLTPDHVRICIAERIRLNKGTGFKMKLGLRNLIQGEDDVATVISEAAVVLAQRRVKVMDSGKMAVLRQTHRPTDLPQKDPEQAREILKRGIDDLRKAIEP